MIVSMALNSYSKQIKLGGIFFVAEPSIRTILASQRCMCDDTTLFVLPTATLLVNRPEYTRCILEHTYIYCSSNTNMLFTVAIYGTVFPS